MTVWSAGTRSFIDPISFAHILSISRRNHNSVSGGFTDYNKRSNLERLEKSLREQKRKQPGVSFPSATKQEHLLIIRFNISHPISEDEDRTLVRKGVLKLCNFFERIDSGKIKMDDLTADGEFQSVPLSKFNFSATLGFGLGFFEKLKIDLRNRPKRLRDMPNHSTLGDSIPYIHQQTDFLIQLCSDFEDVNRWVFLHITDTAEKPKNSNRTLQNLYDERRVQKSIEEREVDIFSIISDWAVITDVHSGFQRMDGRNLMGFNDGISNPNRLSNDNVWTTSRDEGEKFRDGTYMVFQKIEHDLSKWRNLSVEKQEEWVGRSKGTGLLLGTLPKEIDRKLALDLHSENQGVRERAKKKWKKLYDEQKDPTKRFFDSNQNEFRNIQLECPVWSHVRKSNPRQADGAARSLIFRRGYLFIEDGLNGISRSGLLFICFQRDICKSFEYIKKNFLNNKNFPVPDQRKNFTAQEVEYRHRHGRYRVAELRNEVLGPRSSRNDSIDNTAYDPEAQNTGREGLSGPSELGVYPIGLPEITVTLGGGYYFIPPIPNRQISNIAEQFFA